MSIWAHAGPSVLAAFLGSLVEFIEALTIVLAVGTVRGWRPALLGTIAGALLLVILVVLLGPLLHLIRIELLQLVVGMLLLLFGMRWLRKAILRAAGIIPLHDETEAYASETAHLRAAGPVTTLTLDPIAVMTTFKAVVLEGVEVVFIVIAVGAAGNMLIPASIGAAVAGALVVALGLFLHRPLARVPENALKFAVGVLLSAFGVFWIAEGLGFAWIGHDLAIIALVAILLVCSLIAARLTRGRRWSAAGETV
jgi:Ca2+/H+ antiporter, TMEM165/GDT1 family